MKSLFRTFARSLIIAALICATALPAFAETNGSNVNQRELQIYFSTFSNLFGCSKNSYSKFTDTNIGEMEFIPQDQSGATWTKLFTVTVQMLPDSKTLASSAIHGYASNVLNNYARHAKIIDSENLRAPDGTPIIYLEYHLRSGLFREHGVGVYGRHTDTLAAFTRYEVRGRDLNDDERATMRKIAQTLAQSQGR